MLLKILQNYLNIPIQLKLKLAPGQKLKKLDHRSLQIFHKTLKAKSQVKITNPLNNKSLIAEIKSNRVNKI